MQDGSDGIPSSIPETDGTDRHVVFDPLPGIRFVVETFSANLIIAVGHFSDGCIADGKPACGVLRYGSVDMAVDGIRIPDCVDDTHDRTPCNERNEKQGRLYTPPGLGTETSSGSIYI